MGNLLCAIHVNILEGLAFCTVCIPCCQKSQSFFLEAVTLYTVFFFLFFLVCWILMIESHWLTSVVQSWMVLIYIYSKVCFCSGPIQQSWMSPLSTTAVQGEASLNLNNVTTWNHSKFVLGLRSNDFVAEKRKVSLLGTVIFSLTITCLQNYISISYYFVY